MSFFSHTILFYQLQQLEMDNSKLKSDLQSLRKFVSDNTSVSPEASEELMSKLEY